MRKKITITFILLMFILGIFGMTNESHAWEPSKVFPIQEGNYIYFCRQKGYALRFWNGDSVFEWVRYEDVPVERSITRSIDEYYDSKTKQILAQLETDKSDLLGQIQSVIKGRIDNQVEVIDGLFKSLANGSKAYSLPSTTYIHYNYGFSKEVSEARNDITIEQYDLGSKFGQEFFERGEQDWSNDQEALEQKPANETVLIWGPYLAEVPDYEVISTKTVDNSVSAYIMSAGKSWVPNDYDKRNYTANSASDSASINDMQEALWLHKTDEWGETYNIGQNYNTSNRALYDEAYTYKKFYESNIKNNVYDSKISVSLSNPTAPKIIVNKNNGTYTIGPYVTYYPDDDRFSYVEDIYVTDQSGNRINVNRVITADGRAYPGSGQEFFVEISYGTNPTKINLHVDYAYLQSTQAVYQELQEKEAPRIVRLLGKIGFTGDYSFSQDGVGADGKARMKISYKITSNYNMVSTDWSFRATYDAQDAARLISASRQWTKTSAQSTSSVDISMQVAGKVFVDEPATKEGKVDGIYSASAKDKPMSGVTVHLWSRNSNTKIASTKTDGNGNYVFTGLNVLDQYFINFDYNGQYYEPTYYTAPSTSGDYKNTSNGTDYEETRTKLNSRFASIGSTPGNYKVNVGYDSIYVRDQIISGEYNKTYTREQLESAKVIDAFGNVIMNNSSNSELQKMIQYAKDCKMYSWTKNNGTNTSINSDDQVDYYSQNAVLVITQYYDRLGGNLQSTDVNTNWADTSNYATTISTIGGSIDDKSQYINQGYKLRQQVDIALKEDITSATIEINGKTQTYKYDVREASTQDDSKWEIEVRLSDAYYNTQYSRELYPSDYQYKISGYDDPTKYGKTKDDELKVYVTYKLYVKNQSMSIRTRIDEIVHYYDSEYEYVQDRSYIEITRGTNKGKYEVRASETSRYASISGTTTNLSGYQKMYITGLDGIYLDGGQSANIYLTFIVEKNVKDGEQWIKLDENEQTANPIGVGKESISEINGYSTLYKSGTNIPNVGNTTANVVAGLVDVDSNPGNLNPTDVPKDGTINYQNFEDDTDKAPNIRLVLYRGDENDGRITSGYIWEDKRNKVIDSQATATGNGIREPGQNYINGVTVEFVEVMDNGTEYIWRTYENGTGTASKTTPIINTAGIVKDYVFTGDTRGTYAFKSFVPGNYIVRFKYGDTVKTVLAKDSEATKLLINEYGLSDELKALLNKRSYNGHDFKSTIYQAGLGTYNGVNTSKGYNYDTTKGDTILASDAKDLYDVREKVIAYSTGEMNNAFAELLDSYQNVPVYNGSSYNKNLMKAYLDEFIAKTSMVAETGIINMEVEYNRTQTTGNSINNKTTYHLANLDLGLEERPKAQIEVNKDVKNLKITLANGNILFDANQSADNLLWQSNMIYGSYEKNLMTPSKFGNIDNIRTLRAFGLVQPTMDQELMHGATVKITYEITTKNIGEADYKEEQFYYTGVVKDKSTIVTTNAIKVVDYIPNNIQYYEVDNRTYWKVVTPDELINQGLVNTNLKANLEKFNTIVISDKTNAALVPAVYKEKVDNSRTDSVSIPLVLTQLITTENKTKDLTYNNKVELVLQSNSIGRKMAYSVPGNQDPTGNILELDADVQKTSILPPFGAVLTYIIIAIILIAGAAIIAVGIIFIKKKVLTK